MVSVGLLAGILVMLIVRPSEPEDKPSLGSEILEHISSAFRETARSTVRSVVSIGTPSGEGSGVVITPEGHIVTNYHVIEDLGEVRVLFSDRREYEAYPVGVEPSADLAVIQIIMDPGESVRPMTIGDSGTLQVGDWVLAVGNPLGLDSTVTSGIVSATGRRIGIIDIDLAIEDFIQTDAAINPGNSGGALVNLRGELVGINTRIKSYDGYFMGYGFAISVNLVMRVANDLMEFGEFRPGYMGVIPKDVDLKLAKSLGMSEVQGVFLYQVYDEGPADIAGLQSGDVILEMDGRTIDRSNQLQIMAFTRYSNSSVEIKYWRDGRVDSLQFIPLGKDNPDVASWLNRMGYHLDPIAVRYFDRWGLVIRGKLEEDETEYQKFEGVIIQRVIRQEEIPYLQEGMLLERINGQAVHSVEEVIKELRKADEFARFYVRDQWEGQWMVTLTVLKP